MMSKMMSKCIMTGCDKKRSKASFRQFINIPRAENRKRKWLIAAGVNPEDEMYAKVKRYICEDHFCESDFHYRADNGRRHIKPTAVPSQFKDRGSLVQNESVSTSELAQNNKTSSSMPIMSNNNLLAPPPMISILTGRPLALTPAQPGASGLMPNNEWITVTQPSSKPQISPTRISLPPLVPVTTFAIKTEPSVINISPFTNVTIKTEPLSSYENDGDPLTIINGTKNDPFTIDAAMFIEPTNIKEEPELCIEDLENDHDTKDIETIEEPQTVIDITDEYNSNSNTSQQNAVIMESKTDLSKYVDYDFSDPFWWPELTKDIIEIIVKIGPQQTKEFDQLIPSKKSQKFNSKYYNRELANGCIVPRKWLVYSKENDSAFCFPCKLFSNRNRAMSFSSYGCSNWNNFSETLKEHECSFIHMASVQKWKKLENDIKKNDKISQPSAIIKPDVYYEISHWRNVLKRGLAFVKFLVTQNLEIELLSHDIMTSQMTNDKFHKLFEYTGEYDMVLKEHLNRIKNDNFQHYSMESKIIPNEIIDIISQAVKDKIKSECKAAKYYSIILDTILDHFKNERISLRIRCVCIENSVSHIKEYFLGFLEIVNGVNMTKSILQKLESYGLSIVNCRGQSYDKISNKVGIKFAMQIHITSAEPRAFFVPCSKHSLLADISDGAKFSPYADDLFKTIQNLYNFFKTSQKRWDMLRKQGLVYKFLPIGEIQCECEIDYLKPLMVQFNRFSDALVDIIDSHSNDTKNDAIKLCKSISNFQFLASLTVWFDIISNINDCSKYLQNSKMSISRAIELLNLARNYLEGLKLNYNFELYITKAEKLAKQLDIPIEFPAVLKLQFRRKPSTFCPSDIVSNPRQHFREEFFLKIINQAIDTVTERHQQFCDHNAIFSFLYDIQTISSKCYDDMLPLCLKLEESLTFCDKLDINFSELAGELKYLSSVIQPKTLPIDVLNFIYQNYLDVSLPNTVIALRILLTLPLTVIDDDDDNNKDSKMTLIRNYLHTSLTEEKLLNCLAVMYVEKDLVLSLNYDIAINNLAKIKVNRIMEIDDNN